MEIFNKRNKILLLGLIMGLSICFTQDGFCKGKGDKRGNTSKSWKYTEKRKDFFGDDFVYGELQFNKIEALDAKTEEKSDAIEKREAIDSKDEFMCKIKEKGLDADLFCDDFYSLPSSND